MTCLCIANSEIGPPGRKLSQLPKILASLPHLSDEEAASFGADIDAAREELAQTSDGNSL
jgi:hypothetical protein